MRISRSEPNSVLTSFRVPKDMLDNLPCQNKFQRCFYFFVVRGDVVVVFVIGAVVVFISREGGGLSHFSSYFKLKRCTFILSWTK